MFEEYCLEDAKFDLDEVSDKVCQRIFSKEVDEAAGYISSIGYQLFNTKPKIYIKNPTRMKKDLNAVVDIAGIVSGSEVYPDITFLKWFDRKVAKRANLDHMSISKLKKRVRQNIYNFRESPRSSLLLMLTLDL